MGALSEVSFGIRVPPSRTELAPNRLRDMAISAEHSGLDSLWLPDRLTTVDGYLKFLDGGAVVEPLTGLAYIAGITRRIRLGTGVLIGPLRHPLMLAKIISSLQALAGDRVVIGIGAGWNTAEMASLGIDFQRRGALTDEVIAALGALSDEGGISFNGQYFTFENVRLVPPLLSCPVLVAGGAGTSKFQRVGDAHFGPRVLKRIARSGGWFTRPTSSTVQISEGIAAIQDYANRESIELASDFTVAHANWCHLVDGDADQAQREQRSVFAQMLGDELSFDEMRPLHWTGTLSDVRARVEQAVESGVTEVIASPLVAGSEQVDLWVNGVLAPLGYIANRSGQVNKGSADD